MVIQFGLLIQFTSFKRQSCLRRFTLVNFCSYSECVIVGWFIKSIKQVIVQKEYDHKNYTAQTKGGEFLSQTYFVSNGRIPYGFEGMIFKPLNKVLSFNYLEKKIN